VPVVKTGTADRLLRDIEAQGPDQVQTRAGGGTGAGDVSAVLRDLRLHKHHIQQRSSPQCPSEMQHKSFDSVAFLLYAKLSGKSI
jgi:phage tail tape-measure protein